MEIKLKDRVMPRDAGGSVRFTQLMPRVEAGEDIGVLDIFTSDEVVELVNRAIYQLEYQRDSHKKRARVQREATKALEEALKKAGKNVRAETTKAELEGK